MPHSYRSALMPFVCVTTLLAGSLGLVALSNAGRPDEKLMPRGEGNMLVTGKAITPIGEGHVGVGSYPFRLATSPDGKFALSSVVGARSYLSAVEISTGKVISKVRFIQPPRTPGGPPPPRDGGLYYGIAFGKIENGVTPVFVSKGAEDSIGILSLGADGTLTDTKRVIKYPPLSLPTSTPRNPAGLAVSEDGRFLFTVDNIGLPDAGMGGQLHVFNIETGEQVAVLPTPGYPYAIARRNNTLYVSSEAAGTVSVVEVTNPSAPRITRNLQTGADPVCLLLNKNGSRLFVSNAAGDTITEIDTTANQIERTMLLRPPSARGLPGCTPLGMALAPDESRLFVALGDLNAVAVVSTATGQTEGYIPTGWYPSDVATDGENLLVTCARGVQTRNPNGKPVPLAQADFPNRAQYITNIIDGTVSRISLESALKDLPRLSEQVLENNALKRKDDLLQTARTALRNPGIEHVIYVIKENRTYDQVLGDVERGNGDPSLVLFGRDVTPNQHALAERFVLLDNFYCCAEVSGDGWNWSTAGMASHYVSRNVPYGYGGHTRPYDYEGTNNDVATERIGLPDVARAPGGYIWETAQKAGVSVRNYGFFVTFDGAAPRTPEGRTEEGQGKQVAVHNALAPNTDPNFREYDLNYPDSDAAQKHGIAPPKKALTTFGVYKSPSRISEFLREYNGFVQSKKMPGLSLLRLPRDHTSGTTVDAPSARAMVADNDYAVGQLVEAVSRSPYWKKTAIFIVEDDAQNGYDHIDAHRSIAFVISPFVKKNSHDSRFYNTDSTLHTIENLLGLDPMNQYDAIAPTINVFTKKPDNAEPYTAILPDKKIIGQINTRTAYRAADSLSMLNPMREESLPDEVLNEILWRDAKGKNAPLPAKRYGVKVTVRGIPFDDEDDDD